MIGIGPYRHCRVFYLTKCGLGNAHPKRSYFNTEVAASETKSELPMLFKDSVQGKMCSLYSEEEKTYQ